MKILILGATGSIGTQALSILKSDQIAGISFYNNFSLASKLIKQKKIQFFYSPQNLKASNVDSYQALINKTKPTLVINAISGYEGLKLSYLIIKNKIDLALANKETLVVAGKFIMKLAKVNKVKIYPIDSEHSSLYAMLANNCKGLKKLYITCSGGSCYHLNKKTLDTISFGEVIKHPKWDMGYKISVDSATLINKCFEIVEAYWLFNPQAIEAIYHPQSIVHSLIEFNDNSILANLSTPDMRLPIQLAINKFKTSNCAVIEPLSFANLTLNFDVLNQKKWKPLQWAHSIIEDHNNNLGLIINVANEIAIEAFRQQKINFNDIVPFIEKNIKKYHIYGITSFNQIFFLIDLIKNDKKNQF